jgi:GH43 family beta-xylosidase
MKRCFSALVYLAFLLSMLSVEAQNPIIRNQYSADPTARVFGDKVYLFPSHDIMAPENKDLRKDWFCMGDYHVFSSENLTNWTDHGVIVSQNTVKWVDSTSYSMWAPDCVQHNGKYYFYFPANTKQVDVNGRKGFGIGVAVAEKPEGPYTSLDEPIKGVLGIDPNVFIDRDGQAYLIWSQGQIFIARLRDNMCELATEPQVIPNLPQKGLKEGPFMFERNGKYYLTYPHVDKNIERLEYALADSPTGPFHVAGVIMDESASGCWTNHQSVVKYKDQWYLFYHDRDYSPKFDKNRSVRIDSLFFQPDGTIRKVIPTLRGVGITQVNDTIQLDRYSKISKNGAAIAFNDTANYFGGWKTILSQKNAFVGYNSVNFYSNQCKSVEIRFKATQSSTLDLNLQKGVKNIANTLKIPASLQWSIVRIPVKKVSSGIYNITLTVKNNSSIEIDWIRFE